MYCAKASILIDQSYILDESWTISFPLNSTCSFIFAGLRGMDAELTSVYVSQ